MKRKIILLFFVFSGLFSGLNAQDGARRNFNIPDVPGYHTLKCDFHIHTVFSDGLVWPSLRVLEAWQEGLDVIAITDHIEYKPFKSDVNPDLNRPYQLAAAKAEKLGIMLVQGGEITRKMPPGHSNALFLDDVNRLDTAKWEDAFAEAKKQGAFVFWNHPGWKAQQPDTTLWFDEHTGLLNQGMLHGIEIVNYKEYYPAAFAWALEKDLTLLGNSDIHGTIAQEYNLAQGEKRPMTIVFARERTVKGVKDALFEKRTVVLFDGDLYGREEWLKRLFTACTGQENNARASVNNSRSVFVTNYSGIDFHLIPGEDARGYGLIYPLDLPAYSTIELSIKLNGDAGGVQGSVPLGFVVENAFIAPGKHLNAIIRF
ncbi:Sb-PDE family phosphodiesterase [Lentimicrobium sp.]|jgi:hypothetical protein|uniref:Sb-PDE family phosphodiesterase n=1 Tax=Lentimicrobium sp. TaxID=2034841 RepID=UPI0025D7DCCB|nr:Sb-PDE family phosphodiesterase [Lentimicrobium sp.]MCO5255896.1 Sb-PDE family phosphodiesterase [Lentimicrobium sp.]HPF63674.1 Sb-PDE family phosphodiesterase [Lentimicrobium sp.]HPJ61303.1 Sb-PDE family phosphodiesterase [Lentimicrobium sp.]HPR27536.1 Sb-PDE family phosphodiesterase [Lentimicrobium sp.]HRW68784.1 Sb-PDE family phosphodiesterase [Lentimicrobium sp.]